MKNNSYNIVIIIDYSYHLLTGIRKYTFIISWWLKIVGDIIKIFRPILKVRKQK